MTIKTRSLNITDYVQEEADYLGNDLKNAQHDLENIVTIEKEILGNNIKDMQDKKSHAKRSLTLIESYRDKKKMYILVIFVLVCVSLFCIVLMNFQTKLGIPSTTIDLIVLAIILIGFFIIFLLFININSRDPIVFSQLSSENVKDITLTSSSSIRSNDSNDSSDSSNSSDSINEPVCIGDQCCGPGFTYINKKCVFNSS